MGTQGLTLNPDQEASPVQPIDCNGRYHRENGQFASSLEAAAFLRGQRSGATFVLLRLARLLLMPPRALFRLLADGAQHGRESQKNLPE